MTATSQRENEKALEELLDKYAPWGSGQTNGYTHLHMAIMSIAPISDIQLLLEENPNAALVQDLKDGLTPLQLAVQRCGYNPDLIETLVKACPQATKIADSKEKRFPLHHAIQHQAALGAIQSLLRAYPAAAKIADESGQTPIHLAIIKKNVDDDIVQTMIDQCPASATIKYKGWTPLYWAMSCDASTDIILALLDADPTCVMHIDKNGQTPLHVGMAMGAGVDAIRLLLEANEEAASVVDHDGWNPLQHGIRNKAPADAIEAVRLVSPELPRAAGSRKPYETSW